MFASCSRQDEGQWLFEVTEEFFGLSGNACFVQAFTIQGWPVLKRPEVAGFEAPNDSSIAGEKLWPHPIISFYAEMPLVLLIRATRTCGCDDMEGDTSARTVEAGHSVTEARALLVITVR